MPSKRIVMLGAGSGFVINIAEEIIEYASLSEAEFMLMDIDPARLDKAVAAVSKILADKGSGIQVRSSTDAAEALDGVELFHAGTTLDDEGRLVTSGGRVLGVTALGQDLDEARRRAYEAVGCIRWDKEHHRTDIAADAVRRMAEKVQG